MATSGSVDSGGYQGRVLRFEWGTNSINSASNVRNIWYRVTAVGGSSSYYYHHNETVDINGSRVYTGSDSHQVYNWDVLAEGSMDIDQNVYWYVSVSMHGGVYSRSDNISTDTSWDLDAIPRYTTVWNSERGKGLTSISVNWSTSDPRDWTQYSLNDGGWSDAYDVVAGDNKSGYYTISNLQPNTTYKVRTRCRRADSGLWSEAGNIWIKTYEVAKISSVPNLDHGDSLTVKYTNPSSSAISIGIYKTDGTTSLIGYRNCSGSQYTFNFTDEELDKLYKLYGNSNSYKVRVYLKTANNSNYLDYKEITITLKGNQKTAHIGFNGKKRAKVYIGVNGEVKRAVVWIENNGRKRCI